MPEKEQLIRFLGGGKEAAGELFETLTTGGKLLKEGAGLKVVDLPGVGRFVYREVSSTPGVDATIDVNVTGLLVRKLKFTQPLATPIL